MRNPKRKAEKEQMELESTASSVWKRQRSVQKRPEDTERERNSTRRVKFPERKLKGEAIHRNIEFILGRLKNGTCKLGIYGMGGVGKTTIMMHIHNRFLRDATFDVVYITVSQDFSIHKLQSDIGKALEIRNMEEECEMKRAAMLSQHLKRKKNCVLILDDVWEHPPLDLEEVGIPNRADGFKLVLTTRSLAVCYQMQCQETIKIEPLSQEEATSLFLEELGSKVPPNLDIVKSIVKECAGLPIGVITMARSMRGATHDFEWRDALERLKESSMGLKDMQKKVLMILKFSYDHLGDHNVQQCFLSCALYPEDEWINKSKLVEFFIDQGLIDGLIDGLNTRGKQYNRGLSILNKLRNVCLLEDHGHEMKMHDLIRDMALHIMSTTSIVKAGKRLRRIPPEECWTDTLEKVSLMENEISEFPLNMSPNCPKLSTLLLNSSLKDNVVIPDFFFNQLWGLKVLNLSSCDLRELPNSISELVNLRALLLKGCIFLHRIPYLGKLTSLRKLDARNCISLEAPEGLEKLVNLRYLDLFKTRIERLPEGTLDHLLNLQWLKVSAVKEEDITKWWTKWGALEVFGCYLENVDDFNKSVRFIEQSDSPRYYDLDVDLEESMFIAEVSDDTQFGNLGRIVYIWDGGHAIVSVGGECTGIFILIPRDVQRMTMKKCNGMTNLSSMGPLKYLEELDIEEWENLGVLCGGQDKEVINIHDAPAVAPTLLLFSSLRVLEIRECPKLKYLFGNRSKSNLLHLREIKIHDCKEMVGMIAAVTSPPPHPLPFFPSLEEIFVQGCDKMKRAVESEWMPHFPNLRSIGVYHCGKMEEIIGGPLPYLPVEEISLESLVVIQCDNMRKLFPHEWLLHLRNLQCIEVNFCEKMVEMIGRAGQDQEGSITTPVNNAPSSSQPPISLPKLERLVLLGAPQLKSICEVPIRCDSMKHLFVCDCPELKGIPLQLRLLKIEELPYIWVEEEEMWETLMWDHLDAQATLQPYLRKGEHANDRFPWTPPPNAIELSTEGKDLQRLCS